jgi:plastocyanin
MRNRLLVLLATVLGLTFLVPSSPVLAASATVSVTNFAFTSANVTVGQGQKVTWVFHAEHTTTSRQGFWDSGMRSSGGYAVTFPDAGTFAYLCTMHPSMTGSVKVPLKATGTAKKGWTLRWSSRSSTPSNRRFDVQYHRVGVAAWTSFRSATASRTAKFNPAKSAKYVVRARTNNVGHGTSGWSPSLTVTIS